MVCILILFEFLILREFLKPMVFLEPCLAYRLGYADTKWSDNLWIIHLRIGKQAVLHSNGRCPHFCIFGTNTQKCAEKI